MNVLNLMESINEIAEQLKSFIMKHHGNPIFWIILFGLGVSLFFTTYNTLHKD